MTWFQTSTHRSSPVGVERGGVSPVHRKISESGPHGPVGPLDHQLSSTVSSTGTPCFSHSSREAVSGPVRSSPPNTVACSRPGSTPKPSVSSP